MDRAIISFFKGRGIKGGFGLVFAEDEANAANGDIKYFSRDKVFDWGEQTREF